MCGICGVYEYGGRRAADPVLLSEMTSTLHHRGPDDQGFHIDGPIGLGSRRLSIIDLATGQQPIYNEDRTVAVVFNGEVYNYRELTESLRNKGHRFVTESDTEVLAHLYEDHGASSVDHLRGMFGFAVWDEKNRRLTLARDRLGIKPLYYTITNGTLVFGSEIKAILRHPEVSARLDLDALSNYLSLKYVPAPQTFFDGIRALPPGHVLVCEPDGVDVRRYWDITFTERPNSNVSESDLVEQLGELLTDSVRAQLVSDVPFGAFLSGGIDSSTVVALMSTLLGQPVKTFSVGFDGSGADLSELPYARMVAKRYETDHHEVIVGPDDIVELAEDVIWHLDQPIADEACIATHMVARLASGHVKMVLTGEGADELFAGYARYVGNRLSPIVGALPASVKNLALASGGRLPGLRRPKIALYALCQPDEVSRLVNWFPLFNDSMKASLLTESVKGQLNGWTPHDVFAEQLGRTEAKHWLNRMLYVDTKLWLPDDLLARDDKLTMASSLEPRAPLLDHSVVEFAASLPPGLKLKGLTRKYLLRKAAEPFLPPEIIQRKKQGFPIPLSGWFRNEARDFLRDSLSPDAVRRRGLFEPTYVQNLIDEHERGFANHGSLLWGLISVELWHRRYIDATAPSAGPAPLQGNPR